MKLNIQDKKRHYVRITLLGTAAVFLLFVWLGFGRGVPSYDPTLYYMVTVKDDVKLVNPFPNEADCQRFAAQSKSKCFTGSEMAGVASQNK